MNTRQAIQPSSTPSVLSIASSATGRRFVAGVATGLRVFRTDNCLKAYEPQLPAYGGAAIAEVLDDRFCAYVTQHKTAESSGPNVVVFWDLGKGREINRINLYEPILGLRLTACWMAVVLLERTVLFRYALAKPQTQNRRAEAAPIQNDLEGVHAPLIVHSLIATAPNPFALAALHNDLLVLPTASAGQVQLVTLKAGTSTSKRVLRAHNSSIRCMALSGDASLLATASEQGTLVRIYNTRTLDQVGEYRRGVDRAIIQSLAFSPGNRWLASTSDKGTLHIYDLRPIDPPSSPTTHHPPTHRKTPSYATHRLTSTAFEKDSQSGLSSLAGVGAGKHSPAPSTALGTATGPSQQHGSVQEYYGLRPPPLPATPSSRDPTVATAISAFKSSPLAPRIFKDARSTVSAAFYLGDDPPHWQGGPASSWTVAPNGTRRRVKHPVLPLPNDPSGRPPKGLIIFAPSSAAAADASTSDDDGAVLYVIGGGSDARWETFHLLPTAAVEGGVQTGWALVNKGFRRYLTKQFAD